MKIHINKLLLTSLLIIVTLFSYGQSSDYKPMCLNYQKNNCKNLENKYYHYNESSRSALFVKGETSKMNLEIYNGRDYRISICNDAALGDTIELKLIDSESGDVLYDNANNNYSKIFEFTVFESRTLTIEITVPRESGDINAKKNHGVLPKDKHIGCVGVLIEHMITPVKGF